jgi:dolichyl-diphosphooligosaccharide--protein glycosyltransferase/undecaprenyl-diphosphooligosaccharide--protein glycosyltransferase
MTQSIKTTLYENRVFLLLMFLSFSLSIFIRLILAWQTMDSPLHIYDGKFISILSPDPALYGYYAQLLLDGLPHKTDVSMIEYIIYYIVKFTPFSLDQVVYFGPAFFASMIIIPIYLIMSLYIDSKLIIFLSGLVASVGYGFYSRTFLGYFDTDVLNTFFPIMIVYSMLLVIKKEDYRYALLGVLFNMGYLFWYHSSEPIVYALNGFFIAFSILFYMKKSELYKVYILFGVSVVKIAFLYKVGVLAVLFVGFYFVKIDYKYFLLLFAVAIVAILYKVELSQFEHHLNRYLFKSENIQNLDYKFLAPMQFVAEATSAKFDDVVKLLSGNIYIFAIAVLGYVALVFKNKNFLLTLPLAILGVLAVKAGVRFHIYGVLTFIITYGYFVFFTSNKIKVKYLQYLFIVSMFIYPLYESYKSIEFWNTKIARPVFLPEQIKALNLLKEKSTSKDYVVTWWDYGWPIWYYTKMQTMIDNGIHHEDNYSVAKILMSNSQTFTYNATHHLYDLYSQNQSPAIIQALSQDKDPIKLFDKLSKKDMEHKKYVDKYLVLPQQMTHLIYTIFTFANIDPITGKRLERKLFLEFNKVKEDDNFIYLDKGIKIDKKTAFVIQGDIKAPIKKFYHIVMHNNQKLLQEIQPYSSGLHLINYIGRYYLMDDYFFNTTFIQMMFFNNYDKKLFKPVYTGASISIFKLL